MQLDETNILCSCGTFPVGRMKRKAKSYFNESGDSFFFDQVRYGGLRKLEGNPSTVKEPTRNFLLCGSSLFVPPRSSL